MTLVKFNHPLQKTVQSPLSHLIQDLFDGLQFPEFKQWNSRIGAVNIAENEKSFQMEFSVPGFDKSEINIEIQDRMLVVSGTKKAEEHKEEKNFKRVEYSTESFKRSFTLPENINHEAIKAKVENGILQLELPKLQEQTKASKQISIQ